MATPDSGSAPGVPGRGHRTMRLLVAAEGAGLVVLGLISLVLTVMGTERLEAALFETIVALAAGALLLRASTAVIRSIHWRSPVVLLNLLAVPVAVSMAQSGQWVIALALFACAGPTLFLLVSSKPLS